MHIREGALTQTSADDGFVRAVVLDNGSTPCGVHPSIQGQSLLAQTVMARVKK